MKKNSVICAIDVNDFDQDVIDTAAAFADQFGTELNLVHVTLFPDPSNAAWPAYLGSPNILIQDNRKLRRIRTNVAGVTPHHHHLSGLPSEKILGFIERNEPRLVVLGTHGRKGLARLFMGSVAAQVMRQANCPVMILRQRQKVPILAEAEENTE